jgi:hypothetical protein
VSEYVLAVPANRFLFPEHGQFHRDRRGRKDYTIPPGAYYNDDEQMEYQLYKTYLMRPSSFLPILFVMKNNEDYLFFHDLYFYTTTRQEKLACSQPELFVLLRRAVFHLLRMGHEEIVPFFPWKNTH